MDLKQWRTPAVILVLLAAIYLLTQLGEVEFRQAPAEGKPVTGAGGTETFRFAAATGETTLTLVYHRPWEEDVEPLETFTVQVVVR